MKRNTIRYSTLGLAIGLGLAMPAVHAQQAAPQATAAQSNAATTLDSVTVTARRRSESIQDVPVAVSAFGEDLLMTVQLNVRRFVVVYSIPVVKPIGSSTVAPHFERWATGAQHAGWMIGWRDAASPTEPDQNWVETYCYANLEPDFLVNDLHKLYWRTDTLQMTRYFMLEAIRAGVPLSPMNAGYRV